MYFIKVVILIRLIEIINEYDDSVFVVWSENILYWDVDMDIDKKVSICLICFFGDCNNDYKIDIKLLIFNKV